MNKIPVAKIGKTTGLKGWLKLHLLTDFPEQFKNNTSFESDKISLTIENFDKKRNIVKFLNFNTPEEAQKLTNRMLYTSLEESRKNCNLKEDEYFWFDIIECKIVENEKLLGVVKDINRVNEINYLVIHTDENLIKENLPNRFLLDFRRHKTEVNIENKTIYVKDAFEILENS
jgi:16S rRNA processing protein RimM